VMWELRRKGAKYSDPGSRIDVTCERHGDRARLVVRDEGEGIPKEMQEQIFDLFVQQSQALDRRQGGLGLGLAIVKSLIEMHGGDVHVESEGAGKGSRFVVDLPAAQGSTAGQSPP